MPASPSCDETFGILHFVDTHDGPKILGVERTAFGLLLGFLPGIRLLWRIKDEHQRFLCRQLPRVTIGGHSVVGDREFHLLGQGDVYI